MAFDQHLNDGTKQRDVSSPFDGVFGKNLTAEKKLHDEAHKAKNDYMPEAAQLPISHDGKHIFSEAKMQTGANNKDVQAIMFGATTKGARNNEVEDVSLSHVIGNKDDKSEALTLKPLEERNARLNRKPNGEVEAA